MLADERAALMGQARAGDAHSLGLLLESYRNYLTLLADREIGRRLQRKVDAADIVQEAFLEAHRQYKNFQGHAEAQLTEWMRTILAGVLANTVRRYFGTQARDVRLEHEFVEDLQQSSCQLATWAVARESSPSAKAVRGEQTLIIADGLAKLSEDYRMVLMMRHLDGLSFAEIAVKLNRSVDSVEKLWVRGLAKLKKTCAERADHGH